MDEFTQERYPGVTAADLERERRARPPLRRHVFKPGRWRNHRGVRICDEWNCGSLETDSIHKLPQQTEEQRQHEQRKTGERSG